MHLYNIYKYTRLLFLPFVPFYIVVFYLNKLVKKPIKFKIPVICIGNITTGGTGKTPTVIKIAKMLQEIGYSPGIISRGYRGSKSGAGAIVSNGKNILLSPSEVGDEPFLIANELNGIPVAIGKRRRDSINKLINNFQIDVIIMDDGFQNNTIHKDINIVIIDSTRPFGNRFLLPAGDLREFMRSLKRADLIIINKVNLLTEKEIELLKLKINKYSKNKQIFTAYYKNDFLYGINNLKNELPVDSISGKKILLLSSIANPVSLKKALNKLRPSDIKHLSYPDHHWYNEKDIERIIREFDNFDLVITTKKDFVKLSGHTFPDKFFVLKISLLIEENNLFIEKLKQYLKNNN